MNKPVARTSRKSAKSAVDPVPSAISKFVAESRPARVYFLSELVKQPSDNPPGDCAPHAALAAHLLERMDFTVERHAVPKKSLKSAGMKSVVNLIVRSRFGKGGGPVVALNAHGDVVAPGLGWSSDPYGAVIRKGVMYGRGVAVSKSDFATYAFALLALEHSGAKLNGTVELHLTYDEETGGELGPKWLLEQGLSRPDYAICAGFAHGITIAHNGCLHLEVVVEGKSAHAARPDTGRDALAAATGILSDLYALGKSYLKKRSSVPGIASPTLVVGLIEGGINTNVVPDKVTFRIDRRIVPDEDPAKAERELIAKIKAFARKHKGIGCTVKRVLLARPFTAVPGHERLVASLQKSARAVLGERIRAHGVPIYTDARHYSAAGIPTVLYGAGPRTLEEANGHRADENLRLSDLDAATEVVALTLLDLLGEKP